MNMHGVIVPVGSSDDLEKSSLYKFRDWIWQRRTFLSIVVLPLFLLSAYLFLIASNQYESEVHFLVRSSGGNSGSSQAGGLGAMLGMSTSVTPAYGEAVSIADYLTSHDAVETLRRDDKLVERFSRPDADFFSRLRSNDPAPERLLRYYQRQVKVYFDRETGITSLRVSSFRPVDSYELASKLLQLGERRVNDLNARSYTDTIALARRQLSSVESDMSVVQRQLMHFRQNRRDIDPQYSGQAQIGVVSSLTTLLSNARSQLQTMGPMIDHNSPQYKAVAAKVRALEQQVNTQSGRLAGGNQAIATDIGDYEGLQLRQQFLTKRYEAAAATLERARENAIRQQLYVVRIVNPNFPVKPLYPERFRILGTVLIALLITYSIGWLIVAGVREHAA